MGANDWNTERRRYEDQIKQLNEQIKHINEQATERLATQLTLEKTKLDTIQETHVAEIQAATKRWDTLRQDFDIVHATLEKRGEELTKEKLNHVKTHKRAQQNLMELEKKLQISHEQILLEEREKGQQREIILKKEQEEIRNQEKRIMENKFQERQTALDTEITQLTKRKQKDLDTIKRELSTTKKQVEEYVRTI